MYVYIYYSIHMHINANAHISQSFAYHIVNKFTENSMQKSETKTDLIYMI